MVTERSLDPKRHYDPIEKNAGKTAAERYLGLLCEKTFLSLWSYPGVFRDQGARNGGDGKEICDLMVVFGNDIIIFSDKHCEFKDSGNLELDWQRWFRKAIASSASQIWGSERWIRQHPERIFLDPRCKTRLPICLPDLSKAKFHLIVVAHGVSSRIRHTFGGSGSLIVNTTRKGVAMHHEPFHVGDVDPQRTFIHVFDDDSLETVMTTRDTIADFVAYLSKRETLLRGRTAVIATGEEELLAVYLTKLNKEGDHDFVFPDPGEKPFTLFMVEEGHWAAFKNSPERTTQLKADEISYMWDKLIERFSLHAFRGDQHFVTSGGFRDAETILRFMAREPRWKRRHFSRLLTDMLVKTPVSRRAARILTPLAKGDPYYVFLLFPVPDSEGISDEQYRQVRQGLLVEYCRIVRLRFSDAEDIVGIATEAGVERNSRSEDAVYYNGRHWTPEMENDALQLQEKLGILQKTSQHTIQIEEYPSQS